MEFNSSTFESLFSACHARDLQLNVEFTDYVAFIKPKYVRINITRENNHKFRAVIIIIINTVTFTRRITIYTSTKK